jgi:prolyl oligopeptidase
VLLTNFSGWTEPPRWLRVEGERFTDVKLGEQGLPLHLQKGLPEVVVTEVDVPSHDGVLRANDHPAQARAWRWTAATRCCWTATLHTAHPPRPTSPPTPWPGSNAAAWRPSPIRVAAASTATTGTVPASRPPNPTPGRTASPAARWLIAQGYATARPRWVCTGGSAGGIFVGRAVTEAPELFAAVILNVPPDGHRACRAESANGATNVSEFGTDQGPETEFARPAGDEPLPRQVQRRQALPRRCCSSTGMNDPRVDVWKSAKTTAARLQAAQASNPAASPVLLRLDAAGRARRRQHPEPA